MLSLGTLVFLMLGGTVVFSLLKDGGSLDHGISMIVYDHSSAMNMLYDRGRKCLPSFGFHLLHYHLVKLSAM